MISFSRLIPLIGIALILLFSYCSNPENNGVPIEAKYQEYCGSCHLLPDPAQIPKDIWENSVLPEMAARLGYKVGNHNPIARVSLEEALYINRSNTYPKQPEIDSITWKQIHDYVISLAPDSIPIEIHRAERNSQLTQFTAQPISLDENEFAAVTTVQFDNETTQFIIGDRYGAGYIWPMLDSFNWRFHSSLISYRKHGEDQLFTEIGILNPSQIPKGTIYRKRNGKTDTLASEVHRPVFNEIIDLNNDGRDEILVCEFGNLTGELSILEQKGSVYEKRTLLPVPGTINLEIRDMNKDGKDDIIVLASQGDEGLFILYQRGNLKFRTRQVIRMAPNYGSSWFETLDYDRDGDLDIVIVNGYNADLSIFPKPYHGIRLYLNDGEDQFGEAWFYPIYGATRVIAEDFDLDGDFDFAVMSFFPDFSAAPEEGFVYLENINSDEYQFNTFTMEGPPLGRWLVMDNGDVDEDGDMDLMLGSFIIPPGKNHMEILDHWEEQKVDVLYLENNAVVRKVPAGTSPLPNLDSQEE